MDYKYKDIKKIFNNQILGRYVESYLPFYDEHADYNTNAKSYYDYLARYNKLMGLYADLINRLLLRNIEVKDTETIEFKKIGDWLDNGDCPPDNFDDIIKLLANVKVSRGQETKFFKYLSDRPYNIKNSIKVKPDGIWSADYSQAIEDIGNHIGEMKEKAEDQDKEIGNIKDKDKEQDGRLDDLEKQVEDNKNNIENMKGLNLRELIKDKDYKITFHNGFYAPTNDLIVLAGETSTAMDIKIATNSAQGRALKHDGDIREMTECSYRPDKDIPEKSKVFTIEFLGNYAKYNKSEVALDNTSQSLWHTRPIKARASWPNLLTPHNINNKFVWSWRSISDGYGSQLIEAYDEPLSIIWASVDSTITIMKGE